MLKLSGSGRCKAFKSTVFLFIFFFRDIFFSCKRTNFFSCKRTNFQLLGIPGDPAGPQGDVVCCCPWPFWLLSKSGDAERAGNTVSCMARCGKGESNWLSTPFLTFPFYWANRSNLFLLSTLYCLSFAPLDTCWGTLLQHILQPVPNLSLPQLSVSLFPLPHTPDQLLKKPSPS